MKPGAEIFVPSPGFGQGHWCPEETGYDPSYLLVARDSFIQDIIDKHLLKEQHHVRCLKYAEE